LAITEIINKVANIHHRGENPPLKRNLQPNGIDIIRVPLRWMI
jgi:hypothetical protein